MRKVNLTCIGVLVCLLAGTALAHHSFAMFDRNKETTIVGTVDEFQWTNPHSWIELTGAQRKRQHRQVEHRAQ